MNLRSASVHKNDFGEGNNELSDIVGHIELSNNEHFSLDELQLIKTHLSPPDMTSKTIYIVRDGRAAIVSMWHYYNKEAPLDVFVKGDQLRFPTWSNHILSWDPFNRPNTLFLKYEDLLTKFEDSLKRISIFLDAPIVSYDLPARQSIAQKDGRWVRKKSNWKKELKGKNLKQFNRNNSLMLRKLGYIS